MREFKFFRGYGERTLTERLEELLINYPSTPGTGIITWPGTTTNKPTWITNPGYIVPQPYTITTTPGTGTYTIPFSGAISGLSTGFSLTTSNTNGTTYTTANFGGTLTTTGTISTNTFYNSNIK
jgi:hypothetical protein